MMNLHLRKHDDGGRRFPRSLDSRQIRRASISTFIACWLFLSASPEALSQNEESAEYTIKLAFLYNFTKFVEWPVDTFPSVKSPVTLCVFGYNPFGNVFDELIRGKSLNNRDLEVHRINEPAGLKACQIVFIHEKESNRLPEVLKSLAGTSALVVGESHGFAEQGGAFQFFVEENKVRFAINVDAVQRSRLKVSSRLLALARIVHDDGNLKASAW